ncbi:DUF58 domain-containing protein [Rubellicoccus peritrichatus]|uniref:DUF58 domain-containing protein n=1 Tax=Rubellicoccus peritrichatus TaxID=3080537 RepID=A0AAQ3LDQ6_9BACT|nr:DUF58 domain-containing protein [Puniceicoccus sp. CR14]WOO43601.1 DUF58 domain-containing protein [Puniceicoccus sp. CR14]
MIPREYLTRIRQIELKTNRLAEEMLAGTYRSMFKGRGIDFEEVREYQHGDEVRAIDWNVTARTGVPHIRRYCDERELSLVLVLDISASGQFGSGAQSKRELAAEIASVLAFSALKNNDKIALVLCTDEVEHFIPPGKGRMHVFRLIREILFFKPKNKKTSLKAGLDYVNTVFSRRSVVFVISDFLDGSYENSLKMCGIRHDTISIVIYDRHERRLPNAGWVHLEDSETGELVDINTSDPKVRQAFKRSVEIKLEEQKQRLLRSQADYVEIEAGSHYHVTLRAFFDRRLAKR